MRNDYFDGIRGIAIFLVVLLHLRLIECGWVGVQAFFVLSGFLITELLLKAKAAPLPRYLRVFYARRALRIFPLYFSYVLGLALVFAISGEPEAFGRYAVSLFTYTHNLMHLLPSWRFSPWFGHLWSLCVEEQFYLLWPFAVFLLTPRGLERLIVIMIGLTPAIRALVATILTDLLPSERFVGDGVYWFTLSHADAFAFGAAVCVFDLPSRIGRGATALARSFAGIALLGAASLAFELHAGRIVDWSSLGYPQPMLANAQHIWGYTVLDAAFAVVVALAARRDRSVAWLSHPGLVEIGRVSYGIYVVHAAVTTSYAMLVEPWLESSSWSRDTTWLLERLVGVPICFGLSYAIAALSFRYFESRFLAFKARFTIEAGEGAQPGTTRSDALSEPLL